MNNSVLVDHQFIFADGAILAAYWLGLINEVKILVQELGGQRGGLILRRIWYTTVDIEKLMHLMHWHVELLPPSHTSRAANLSSIL